jgi:hypothetical protein
MIQNQLSQFESSKYTKTPLGGSMEEFLFPAFYDPKWSNLGFSLSSILEEGTMKKINPKHLMM